MRVERSFVKAILNLTSLVNVTYFEFSTQYIIGVDTRIDYDEIDHLFQLYHDRTEQHPNERRLAC